MEPQVLLRQILFLFGLGFLIANAKVIVELLQFRRRKRTALLTWEASKPPYYGFSLALGVTLGLLLAFKIFIQRRPPDQLFGEAMMFVYYGYIALIAFNKPFLAQPIGGGVTTLGIPLGMFVIVFTIVITGIYVRRANSRYDALTQDILRDAQK